MSPKICPYRCGDIQTDQETGITRTLPAPCLRDDCELWVSYTGRKETIEGCARYIEAVLALKKYWKG